jgi:hypothetical protein
METSTGILGVSTGTFLVIVLVVAALYYVAFVFYKGRPTMQAPRYAGAGAGAGAKEGFYGGAARGTGLPDCMHSSAEGSALIAMFMDKSEKAGKELGQGRVSTFGDADLNKENLSELTQIVSKLACFKKDLVSPAHIVEATRYQPFATAHDIEPIAETTGRCFAKTVSPRDLEISFDKWTDRGEKLIRMLCTAMGFNGEELDKAHKLFISFTRDVKDIARGKCLQGDPSIAGKLAPRDAGPYEAPELAELGPYNGYF